jgi:hypothetical protein
MNLKNWTKVPTVWTVKFTGRNTREGYIKLLELFLSLIKLKKASCDSLTTLFCVGTPK